jgi:hypothetical protein
MEPGLEVETVPDARPPTRPAAHPPRKVVKTVKFIQIIEFKTSRIDDFNARLDEWMARTEGAPRIVTRATQTRDRDAENTYVHIVEFPSYEEAMENSNRPETTEFSRGLAELCDGAPVFRNLDVLREDELS